ncbi:hypothetical protein BHE74_00029319 [Ensete ventricosum]|nr:hypothetical protein GW17_00031482 [Ensete ventricosum]RWW63482.1 hypothetical protein BHE74_00029319 [Ensete ventricosum]RZR89498.1 hypothetical protein BHM03_00017224 [Ensete ventricosum]
MTSSEIDRIHESECQSRSEFDNIRIRRAIGFGSGSIADKSKKKAETTGAGGMTAGGSKPAPLLCWKWKWPWDSQTHSPDPTNPCGNLDAPWLFKSLQTLASLAQNLILLHPSAAASSSLGASASPTRRGNPAGSLSREEQGEAEHRALALALASGKEATVLEFYSPKCRLCNSLLDLVLRLEARNSDWVSFVLADAENEMWLPEVIPALVSPLP